MSFLLKLILVRFSTRTLILGIERSTLTFFLSSSTYVHCTYYRSSTENIKASERKNEYEEPIFFTFRNAYVFPTDLDGM